MKVLCRPFRSFEADQTFCSHLVSQTCSSNAPIFDGALFTRSSPFLAVWTSIMNKKSARTGARVITVVAQAEDARYLRASRLD